MCMCACMCVYLYIYMFIKSSKNIKNNKTFICLRRTNILKKRIQKIWKNIYIFQFICVKILYKNPFTRTTYRFVNLIIFAHFFIFNLIEKKFQLIRFSRNRKEIKRKINKANILRCERIKKKIQKKGKIERDSRHVAFSLNVFPAVSRAMATTSRERRLMSLL